MAIKYYDKYPQRWESPSQDYPQGAFKNLSATGEKDGSYLEKDWLNDQSGFFGALLRNAEMTPNGLVDTAQKSQFYDALLVCAKKAVDLSGYYTKTQVDAEIQDNKTEIANEWGSRADATLSQDFISQEFSQIAVYKNISKYPLTRESFEEIEKNYSVYVGNGVSVDIGEYTPIRPVFGTGTVVRNGINYKLNNQNSIFNTTTPNTIYGLASKDVGTFNTFFGFGVGTNANADSKYNILIGHNLGSGDTILPENNKPFSGSGNVGIGRHTLKKNQSGNANVAVGEDALNENYTGNHNIALGFASLQQAASLSDNVSIGSSASSRTTGGRGLNVTIGRNASKENKDGAENVIIGWGTAQGAPLTANNYVGDGVTKRFKVGEASLSSVKDVRVDIDGVNVLPRHYSVDEYDVILQDAPVLGAQIDLTYTIGSSKYDNSVIIGARAGSTARTIYRSVIIGHRSLTADAVIDNKIVINNHSGLPFIAGDSLGARNIDNRIRFDSHVLPATDATRTLGSGSYKYTDIFLVNAPVVTSDVNAKTNISYDLELLYKAMGNINFCTYRLKDAVRDKGQDARIHLGVIAQDVIKAFKEVGLDALDYGIVCLSKWDSEIDQNGAVLREAGEMYSVRYEELLILEAAYQRHLIEKLLNNK